MRHSLQRGSPAGVGPGPPQRTFRRRWPGFLANGICPVIPHAAASWSSNKMTTRRREVTTMSDMARPSTRGADRTSVRAIEPLYGAGASKPGMCRRRIPQTQVYGIC
jgi:hypothetical protein